MVTQYKRNCPSIARFFILRSRLWQLRNALIGRQNIELVGLAGDNTPIPGAMERLRFNSFGDEEDMCVAHIIVT